MFKDRSLVTAFCGLILVVVTGYIKPQSLDPTVRNKVLEDQYWVVKTHGKRQFGMIIMGDSRSYIGLSPSIMEEILNGFRILNYGYKFGGLNPVMYRAAESRLDLTANKKSIILGISPMCLIDETNTHFLQEKSREMGYIFFHRHLTPLLRFFKPTSLSEIKGAIFRSKIVPPYYYYKKYYRDGWVAAQQIPEDPSRAITEYRAIYEKHKVSDKLIQDLISQTKQWVSRGIRIFALRIPCSDEMRKLESELCSFDEKSFKDRFEEAGGRWIDLPNDVYQSFDGTHLNKDSAVRLSKTVATSLKDLLFVD